MNLPEHSDVIVVGAGPVGALLARRLAAAGRQVLVLEARSAASPVRDARALALSWASREAFVQAGLWPGDAAATAIDIVHVSQQGALGRTVLSRDDLLLPHLGMVVGYPALADSIAEQLDGDGVTLAWDCKVIALRSLERYAVLTVEHAGHERMLTARLVVLAEGGQLVDGLPGMRRLHHDYQQCALLAEVQTSLPHQGVAYERFARSGPLALLPRGDAMMLVWTRSPADAERLQEIDEAAFLAELSEAFGERLGEFVSVGARAVFPLTLRQASKVNGPRVALIGNAAQTMHPVAAQGLNLGVRDALELAATLNGAADPGDVKLLARYAARRRLDSHAVVGFTHGLIQLFDGHGLLTRRLRGMGMAVLDALPAARRSFASHLVFGVGR